jgi:hypothetical protein
VNSIGENASTEVLDNLKSQHFSEIKSF